MIEDIFKLAKNAFPLKNFHRYTKRSVKKFVCLHVLLVGIVVSLGINSKEELQKIAEWQSVEGANFRATSILI